MKAAKKIIIEELRENSHPVKVEDVIFWALEYYANSYPEQTWGKLIANNIKERILEAENNYKKYNESDAD
jgi:hypothetical protein